MPRRPLPLEAKKIDVRVFLDPTDVNVIDQMIRDGAYSSRSDVIRDIVRNALRRRE